MSTPLIPGDQAPAFTAPNQTGQPVSLSDFSGKTVVLYFYPKDNTPGCTTEACAFRDDHVWFTRRRIAVLGISPDTTTSHASFAKKYQLPFPLLADTDHRIATAYGCWVEKRLYGKTFMGVQRSTFIIGPDGKIRSVFRNVKPATHLEEVRAALGG
jgi:peroxiredoxin Q/BCP